MNELSIALDLGHQISTSGASSLSFRCLEKRLLDDNWD
jgi:hypothetical protein